MAKTKHEFILVGKDQASQAMKSAGKSTSSLFDKTFKLTSIMSSSIHIVGAVAKGMKALGGAMASPIKLAAEQAKVEAQLGAVLESTGHAAGLNADQLKNMASEMQSMTTFGDEAVIGAQNLLLTFTNIGGAGGIFERTTKTVLDVSTAMGQDLKASSIQLGKALNDPIKGVSALGEVGITFSDSQKEMIKTLAESGDIMGAQTLILDELDKQFGGSAETLRGTFAGSITAAKNVFGDLQEMIGKAIIENPQLQAVIRLVTQAMGDMANQVAAGTGPFGMMGDVIGGMVSTVIPAMIDAAAFLADTLAGNTGLSVAINILNNLFDIAAFAVKTVINSFRAFIVVMKMVKEAVSLNFDAVHDLKNELVAIREEVITNGIDAMDDIADQWEGGSETAGKLAESLRGMAKEVREATTVTPPATAAMGDFRTELTEAGESADQTAPKIAEVEKKVFKLGDAFESLKKKAMAVLKPIGDQLIATREIEKEMEILNATAKVRGETEAETQRMVERIRFEMEARNEAEEKGFAAVELYVQAKMEAFDLEQSLSAASAARAAAEQASADAAKNTIEQRKAEEKALEDARREAQEEYARSVEAQANTASEAWNSAFQSVILGQESAKEAFGGFAQGFKEQMTAALLDPIMGAEGPLHGLFSNALKPVMDMGQEMSAQLFAPMVEGLKNYFSEKAAAMATDASTEVAINASTSGAVTAQNAAAGAASAAAWTPAAIMTSIATLGAALAFGFLVTQIVSKIMGYEKGGFVDKEHLAMVGEGNKPEVIIPLTKPDRAKSLLAETFNRHPELFLSALSGRGAEANPVAGATNNFSITVNGAADPNQTSMAVVNRIDQMLGRRINARI